MHTVRFVLTMAVALLLASRAAAAAAPTAGEGADTDQAVCQGHYRGDLCTLSDGMGGTCELAVCADGARCLRCARAPLNNEGDGGTTGFLVLGVVLTLGFAVFFVWKLLPHWRKPQ